MQPKQGDYMLSAAQGVSDNISKALARYEEEKKKKEFNEGVFEMLKGQTDSQGNPYIPHEALARWHSMNPDKQAGVLSLAAARAEDDAKARYRQRAQQEEALNLSAAEMARAHEADVTPLRQSRGSFMYAPTTQAGSPVFDQSGNQIGVYDAKGKITKLGTKKDDPMSAMLEKQKMESRQAQVTDKTKKLLKLQAEVAKGNKAPGLDAVSLGTSYEDQIRDLQVELAALQDGGGDSTTATDSPAARPETGGGPPVKVGTAEQYAALPSGAVYIDERDGKTKRKK